MAACSASKGPSLEGFDLGFDTLRRKVGEKLVYGHCAFKSGKGIRPLDASH